MKNPKKLEILTFVLDRYKFDLERGVFHGLCYTARLTRKSDLKISRIGECFILRLIKDEGNKQSVFYFSDGETCDESDQFLWHMRDSSARLKFLKNQIKNLLR